MTIDRAVCIGIFILVMIYLAACTDPPDARNICAAPPVDRSLWDKACEGMFKPRRPPEGLCSDPDGRQLWPFDYAIRCKEK